MFLGRQMYLPMCLLNHKWSKRRYCFFIKKKKRKKKRKEEEGTAENHELSNSFPHPLSFCGVGRGVDGTIALFLLVVLFYPLKKIKKDRVYLYLDLKELFTT